MPHPDGGHTAGSVQMLTGDPDPQDKDKPYFSQAEAGIRVVAVTGVETCALPIFERGERNVALVNLLKIDQCNIPFAAFDTADIGPIQSAQVGKRLLRDPHLAALLAQRPTEEIGRASCRERV